jgi:hypothetical protein
MVVTDLVVLGADAVVDVVAKWPATMPALEVILSLAVGRRGLGAASVGVDSVTKGLRRGRERQAVWKQLCATCELDRRSKHNRDNRGMVADMRFHHPSRPFWDLSI